MTPHASADVRTIAADLLAEHSDNLDGKERGFLRQARRAPSLTPPQVAWLRRIHSRLMDHDHDPDPWPAWRLSLDAVREHMDVLTDWEAGFVRSLAKRTRPLTFRQAVCLGSIVARVQQERMDDAA